VPKVSDMLFTHNQRHSRLKPFLRFVITMFNHAFHVV